MLDAETDYKLQGKTIFQGIPVSIENRKGSYRSGIDPTGKSWKVKMNYHYGRIPRTRGTDGDMLDVYIGPEKKAENVYIIEQVDPDTGRFDEYKCMLGFPGKMAAVKGYKSQYNNPGFYGGCITKSIEEFKDWIKELAPAKVTRKNMENRIANAVRTEDSSMSDFDKLVNKLMKENGYSEARARRIAYSIGVKKYGKAGMTAKSVAGRKDAAPDTENEIKDEHIGFDKLVSKIMKERGYSKERAQRVAYAIGKEKYGKAGMAAKSAAGRDSCSSAGKDACGVKSGDCDPRDIVLEDSPEENETLSVLQGEGAHEGVDYSQFDQKELALGILVELEHADSVAIAAEIAADHLTETPDYYTKPTNPFMEEIANEYFKDYTSSHEEGEPMKDANPIAELLLTPVIKSLMKFAGFKKLFWSGNGWSSPIGLGEYSMYLKKVTELKVFDRLLQKFGYEISISPLLFSIKPVK